jgi:NDP-sugar pyrophosphorylase family protein
MLVIIPCAGKGSRFAEAGYKEFKPFLPLNGKTMLECVVENVSRKEDRVVVITRPEYSDRVKYQKIITGETEGAACTILKAHDLLCGEVLIANSDQLVDIDITDFLEHARKYDGCILTFPNDNPKWSYAKTDGDLVTEVAEKVVVSDKATVGIYYYKEGGELVQAINRMIEDDFRVNGEYYLCPAYNYYPRHKKIGFYNIKESQMHGLGVPEDYNKYLEEHVR